MEKRVFSKKSVSSILKSGYVEARLHTDLTKAHPQFKFNERIQAVRVKFLGKGNVALPHYFVVDPKKPFVPIAKRSGSEKEAFFAKFFAAASSLAAKRKEKAAKKKAGG